MQVADYRLTWTPSPSRKIMKRELEIVTKTGEADEVTITKEVGANDVQFLLADVLENTKVTFRTYVTRLRGDTEERVVSTSATFYNGDLSETQPDTNLAAELVGVREVPDQALVT